MNKYFGNKDFIYTRDLDILVHNEWKPIMYSIIKNIEDYIKDKDISIYISYVKDKYGYLRIEYMGGDKYIDSLISIAEDLSFYMVKK